jgi:hypothetical protein
VLAAGRPGYEVSALPHDVRASASSFNLAAQRQFAKTPEPFATHNYLSLLSRSPRSLRHPEAEPRPSCTAIQGGLRTQQDLRTRRARSH